jgi:dTDP-glucose 4,6-dehydratase
MTDGTTDPTTDRTTDRTTDPATDRTTDPATNADRAYRRLLVTGGAGFIGSCYVRDVLARRDGTEITVLDKLTYAGNEANLAPVRADPEQAARLRFVVGDIADRDLVNDLVRDVDAVINFAAESHVDRSILDPEAFLVTGVIGVHVLLEACRTAATRPRYLQVSTDEVYGSVAEGHSREGDPLAPRSPYAAAKASGELLVGSYVVTHGLDAVVTRGSNTYGPYHHPEKLIPLFVTNAIDDLPLPLYGDGLQRRDWLYVSDHAAGIDHVLRHGRSGETYNVAGGVEMANRDTVRLLLEHLGKPWSLVRHVEDRPGHDRRYAMDGSKLAALGWRAETSFEDGLARTIDWFVANEAWWRAARSGDWDAYYERQYGQRLRTAT